MRLPNEPQATPDWQPEAAHCAACGRFFHVHPECFPLPAGVELGEN